MLSLSDIYSNMQKRANILSEAKLVVSFDDAKRDDIRRSIADEYVGQVLGLASRLEHDMEPIIAQWIEMSGWNSTEAKRDLYNKIHNVLANHFDLDDHDVVVTLIVAIRAIIKAKHRLQSFKTALEAKSTDFVEFFYRTIKKVPEAKIFDSKNGLIRDFVSELTFSEGQVAVGPGEVFVTLFSEAVNPSKGDLEIPGVGEVELKGSVSGAGGRPGKGSSSAAVTAMKFIQDELKSIKVDALANLDDELSQLASSISYAAVDLLSIFEDKASIQSLTAAGQSLPRQHDAINAYNDILKIMSPISNRKIKHPSLDKLRKIDKYITPYLDIVEIDADIAEYINSEYLNELFFKYDNIRNAKMAGASFEVFFQYLSENKKDKELVDLAIEAISKFSIHTNIDSKTRAVISRAWKSDIPAANIVAMIQCTDYYTEEGFKYLVFFNSTLKQVVFGPFGNSYAENLKLNMENADLVKIVPSTGGSGPYGTGGRGGFMVIPI